MTNISPHIQKKGTLIWKRELQGFPRVLALSPSRGSCIVGFEDGEVDFFNKEGELLWEINVGQPVTQVGILHYKKLVVVLDEYSRLHCIDFRGKLLFSKTYDAYWSSFGVKSGNVILWGWKSKPLKINSSGKILQELELPHPRRKIIPVPKKDLYWVVHNQVCLGLYNSKGKNIWLVNNPVPMDLSREHASEFSVNDNGEVFAITCHENGIFVYNSLKKTLNQIDLDRVVSNVFVSGDGQSILIGDGLNSLFLVSPDAQILWQMELNSPSKCLAVDKSGKYIVVLEENGDLSSYQFSCHKDKRSNFLELKDQVSLNEKFELWKIKLPFDTLKKNSNLQVSKNGKTITCGSEKDYFICDSSGNPLAQKSFLTPKSKVFNAKNGDKVFFYNDHEIFIQDCKNQDEKHLTFYQMPLKEVVIDPGGKGFLTLDKGGNLSYYSENGEMQFTRNSKKPLHRLSLDTSSGFAIFQGSPRTIFILNLKTLKARHIVLGGSVNCLDIKNGIIFVGGQGGRCHAIDGEAKIIWKFKLNEPVKEVIPIEEKTAFVTTSGTIILVDFSGRELGKFKLKSSRSVVTWLDKDIFELVKRGDTVSCQKLSASSTFWKINVGSLVQNMAAPGGSNRVFILDSSFLHCHQLIPRSNAIDDRSSFLEFD